MKGYNRENKLKLVIRVQEEYLKYANSGLTTAYIYRTYIYPKFLISQVFNIPSYILQLFK